MAAVERRGGNKDILWYYRALIDAYRRAGDHINLVDELGSVVQDLRQEIARNTPGSGDPAPATREGCARVFLAEPARARVDDDLGA